MNRFRVQLAVRVGRFLETLDTKSRRICTNNLQKLAQDPYPGKGRGDKERLVVRGEEVFRLHIGRRYTAFYVIIEKQRVVRVFEILPIGQAHKTYGYK